MNPKSANLLLLTFVATQLGELREQLVFVGGSTTELFISDQIPRSPRPTKDVDTIVHALTRLDYQRFSQLLRAKGFVEDTSQNAPLCRWKLQDATLDVMPTEESILGFTNRWYVPALQTSSTYQLNSDVEIRLIQAPYFIATKLEAFFSRGNNDYFMSHDLEDIIMVFDGRKELVSEINQSAKDLKEYIKASMQQLLASNEFLEALVSHLPSDAASQARYSILVERFRQVA